MKMGPIKAVADASMLDALIPRAVWRSALPPGPTPMQHFIWSEACLAAIYPDAIAETVTVPGGVAAFVRKGRIPALYLVGAEELAEPSEPAYANAAAADLIAAEILARGLPVKLGQPIAGTPFAAAFLTRARRSGLLITRPTEGSPYIELDETWHDALERFSSRRRSDFRRMRRRADELGTVTFAFHEPGEEDAAALLEQAIEVEARSWKARSGTAIADNPDQAAFFRHYARLAATEGILRIAFLKIGDDLVASQIAVECDNAFWLFKIGYDERFARCSPGQLLMLESIERAARKGLCRFELLGKSAEWTRFWAQSERPRMRLVYYPWNLIGACALARDGARLGIKRAIAVFRDLMERVSRQPTDR
jgi:CelD/BcsL family acetyltransferase involved in cellulose biosynthesis